uniref:Uncharacterized protein n=1 Tax=Lactuca sativa TaxID=4236 RepID=A0A9R1WWD4_LACSA|nr:hypothetical protein LSAT_V11C800405490 [Lactuca sativa]
MIKQTTALIKEQMKKGVQKLPEETKNNNRFSEGATNLSICSSEKVQQRRPSSVAAPSGCSAVGVAWLGGGIGVCSWEGKQTRRGKKPQRRKKSDDEEAGAIMC